MRVHEKKNAPSTTVLDFSDEHSSRCADLIRTISQTEKMIIVCGSGVCAASGMPSPDTTVQLRHGKFQCQTTLRKAIKDCSRFNLNAKNLGEDKLAAFNKVMADLRIRARSATPSTFHQLLQHTLHERRVVRCLTCNFDGLETIGDSENEGRVVMMYGDNRRLHCCTEDCAGVDAQRQKHIEDELLSGRTVLCPPCTKIAETMGSQRRVGRSSVRFLRPEVHVEMADNLLPLGDLRDEILEAAASCKLLLLVGVSLKCPETFGLIYDLSSKVHEQSGAVVLVDPKPTKGRNTSHCIDFHLKVEIEDFSAQTLVAMNFKRQSPAGDVETLSPAKSESRNQWYEVSASRGATAATLSPRSTTSGQVMGNNVQSEISVEDCQPTEPMCCLCNITVTECLLQCTECGDYLCYPGKFNPEGRIRSCIVALKHPGERDGRYTKPAADNFVCPWCWKHSERGVYPVSC
ncbi:hypothetical protein FS749_005000 [Ceratobasidium sp. UAMH 11750]|nr:hypothetical protein FS749_005000 [Ceratobasidium sp. UAMH 11750]